VDETVAQLRSEGLEVRGCACHVGDEAQRRQLVTNTLEVGATASETVALKTILDILLRSIAPR
jgi:hypothetical protein